MKLVKHFLILLLFGTLSRQQVCSQQTVFEETQVLYFSETAGGLVLHTSGWGINFLYAENITGFKKRVFEAELVGMKHEKEIKTLSDFQNVRGYFYGKLNSLTILRTSFGIQNTFIPKQSIKGVAISLDYNIGISHGFAKPVYLSIRYSNNEPGPILDEIRDERYDPEKHFPDNIVGRSPLFKGLGKTRYYPGIYGKVGLNFEYSDESDFIRAIEVGVTADVFAKPIPMMAFNPESRAFTTIYFNFLFGKKKTAGERKSKDRAVKEAAEPDVLDLYDE